jgi:hypothetical protein
LEIAHHRGEPIVHILHDAVEEEIHRPQRRRTPLPPRKQRTVEQKGGGGRVLGHARWLSLSARLWQSDP